MWNAFKENGALRKTFEWRSPQSGAVAASKVIEPGETFAVRFIFAWYFPVRTDSRGKGIRYKNAYATHFEDSFAVAKYMKENMASLEARTEGWRTLLRDSNLPSWLTTKLINDTFPLYSNSIFDEKGRFASSEAPGSMSGCMGTMDQRAASHAVYAMGFPFLSQSELTLFSEQQIGEDHPECYATHWDMTKGTFDLEIDTYGAILHDVGWDDLDGGRLGGKSWRNAHWPDLSLVYTLQCFEQVAWTGDRAFLSYVYPKVKAALAFNRRLDQNDDGIAELWGPGCCTFDSDAFHYYGASTYVATLTLAATKAAMKMARRMGDDAFANELAAWYEKARTTTETKLFSEDLGYFYSWVDDLYEQSKAGERPHERESRNSMAAQLAGTWFANLLGLGEVLNPEQVASALDKMVEKNIGLCAFCPAQEVSDDNALVSFSWPFYAEAYIIAHLFYAGRADAAMDALYRIHTAMTTNDGSPWSVPLVWKGEGNGEREWGAWYMTATSSWFTLPAICGVAYNAIDGALSFAPNIPQTLGTLKDVPLFFPTFTATVTADASSATLTVRRLIDVDALTLTTITTRTRARISVKGDACDVQEQANEDGTYTYTLSCALHAGDTLTLSYAS